MQHGIIFVNMWFFFHIKPSNSRESDSNLKRDCISLNNTSSQLKYKTDDDDDDDLWRKPFQCHNVFMSFYNQFALTKEVWGGVM